MEQGSRLSHLLGPIKMSPSPLKNANLINQIIGPTQVKCQLLISSIFDAMNF